MIYSTLFGSVFVSRNDYEYSNSSGIHLGLSRLSQLLNRSLLITTVSLFTLATFRKIWSLNVMILSRWTRQWFSCEWEEANENFQSYFFTFIMRVIYQMFLHWIETFLPFFLLKASVVAMWFHNNNHIFQYWQYGKLSRWFV